MRILQRIGLKYAGPIVAISVMSSWSCGSRSSTINRTTQQPEDHCSDRKPQSLRRYDAPRIPPNASPLVSIASAGSFGWLVSLKSENSSTTVVWDDSRFVDIDGDSLQIGAAGDCPLPASEHFAAGSSATRYVAPLPLIELNESNVASETVLTGGVLKIVLRERGITRIVEVEILASANFYCATFSGGELMDCFEYNSQCDAFRMKSIDNAYYTDCTPAKQAYCAVPQTPGFAVCASDIHRCMVIQSREISKSGLAYGECELREEFPD
jgi:hypothetical protein